MRFTLLLLSLMLLPLQLLAESLCDSLNKDLKELQKAESSLAHPESGEKLLLLQDQYDAAVADYTIYKGIDDLRTAYFKFNEDVTSLNLGSDTSKDNQILSYLKNFINDLVGTNSNPKMGDLRRFREDLRNGMSATAGILVMEDLIDRLFVNESLQEKLTNQNLSYSSDEFLTELKIQCDRKDKNGSAYEKSSLCQELFTKDAKGTLSNASDGHARQMTVGFFEAYKALLRGEKTEAVKQKLSDYKRTLMAQMPKSSFMQKQLQLVRDVDLQLDKSFQGYREGLKVDPNLSISPNEMAAIMDNVKKFSAEMDALSTSNDRLIGAKERDAIKSATRDSRIKTQFGNLQEVIDSLASKVDKTQDDLISALMGNYEINRARRALAAQVPLDGVRERNPEDEFRKAFNSLGIPSCKDMTFHQSAQERTKHRDSLYQCLSDMNKVSNTSIAQKIKEAKDKVNQLKNKISAIEKTPDYKSFNFLKRATIHSLRTNCKQFQEKKCRPEEQSSVLLDGEKNLSYLTNSMGEILSLYDKDQVKEGGLSTKEVRERSEYCRDTYYSSLASTICRSADIHEQMVTSNKTYRFTEGHDGMKSNPELRPSNTEIWISAAKTPIQNMVPFLLQYRNTNATIGPATNYAKQVKAYNYVTTEYWKNYYEKFPTVGIWGTSSLYPTYYNPLGTTTFNYGSTNSYYGSTLSPTYYSSTGFNFSN